MNDIKHSPDAYKIEPKNSQRITAEKIRDMIPRGSRANVGDAIVKLVQNMGADTDLPQNLLEEEFLGNLHHIGKMRGIGTEEIINATKFCNLTRNHDNKKAWSIVFPDKYDKLVEEGRQIDSHVSMYKTSKLVRAIDEEMLIPVHLQYAPYHHASIKQLYKIGALGEGGTNAKGEEMTVTPMVRVQALKELAALTKQPERAKIDITVNQGEEAALAQQDMNDQLKRLADMQANRYIGGESIEDIQIVNLNLDIADTD